MNNVASTEFLKNKFSMGTYFIPKYFTEFNNAIFLFSITGAMGICFPYLGEFQPNKYRETILCWMELFWTLGVIILPGMYPYKTGYAKRVDSLTFISSPEVPSISFFV